MQSAGLPRWDPGVLKWVVMIVAKTRRTSEASPERKCVQPPASVSDHTSSKSLRVQWRHELSVAHLYKDHVRVGLAYD